MEPNLSKLKSSQDPGDWLALFTVPNVGPIRFISLVKHFGSPEAVLSAPEKELSDFPDVGPTIASNIKKKVDWRLVEKQLELMEKNQVQLLTFRDEGYPENLKSIYNPPPFLFIKGEIKEEDKNAIAIVGSRAASLYGKQIAEKIGRELAKRKVTIISGLAWGIDSIGHLSALAENSRTIAVFGSGLDVIYPPQNGKLVERIIQNGAILSEFLLGTKPEKQNFPRRNRLISGLSLGVVIIEAGAKSGALLTACHALEQNREVFAVPGNIDAKTSEGTNKLIKDGAKLVTSVEDILEELNIITMVQQKEKGNTQKDLSQLSEIEKSIYNLITDEPYHIDKIAQDTRVTPSQALSTLLSLELKGFIKQLSGKMFVRT
jgi:DNA processing protein